MSSVTGALKKALRKEIRSRLATVLPYEIASQSQDVTAEVLRLPAFQSSSRISVYLSMPTGEISTSDIVGQALDMGKQVFVPYIGKAQHSEPGRQVMHMLALHSREDLDGLKPDRWGIPSLGTDTVQTRENALGAFGPFMEAGSEANGAFKGLDLVLMPGLGFDLSNGRLGHGKGFYDHFLQRYSLRAAERSGPAGMPLLVGLALKQQMLATDAPVPMDQNDWKVDQVIVGS